jgi:hypothetical protein
MAHGPGDASLARGLHGEMELMKPIVASSDPGPPVRIEPWIEHWSRRYKGKTYIIAATTHGMAFGQWRPGGDSGAPAGRARVTEVGTEAGGYAAHGIQYLPAARSWPAGTRLVQWVRLDDEAARGGFAVLVKADARFTHAASWGSFGFLTLKINPLTALWFLRTFYRHATGFLGWDLKGLAAALQYVPGRAADMGRAPAAGGWTRIEVELDKLGTVDKLIDGVGFIHARGRIEWGRTAILGPGGRELEVWGDAIQVAPERLAQVRISVQGLRAGTRVRVLFEDRELTAASGHFVDDFRGRDLYQRFGGGPSLGYGDAPVALHVYEVGGRTEL